MRRNGQCMYHAVAIDTRENITLAIIAREVFCRHHIETENASFLETINSENSVISFNIEQTFKLYHPGQSSGTVTDLLGHFSNYRCRMS